MLLQLRKVANHKRIVEIRHHLVLEQVHVVCGELAQAFFQLATQSGVLVYFACQDVLNELFTFGEVRDDFAEIASEQLLVGQKTLLFEQFANLVLIGHVAPLQDCHGVVVLLTVKNDIHARLLILLQIDLEGTLSEHLNLLNPLSFLLQIFVYPFRSVHLRSHHKTQYLQYSLIYTYVVLGSQIVEKGVKMARLV